MNNQVKCALIITLCGGILVNVAQAEDLTIGAGAVWSTKIYKGVNKNSIAFPDVNYESDHFYIHGLSAGLNLLKTPADRVSVTAYYMPLSFDASDSHDDAIHRLNNRHGSLMAGISYEHHTQNWGLIRTVFARDILNNSNGLNWDTSWVYPLQFGPVSLAPAIGVNWSNSKFNRYYYGISRQESRRSGLSQYSADDSWSPFFEIGMKYSMTNDWSLNAGARYTALADEIKDSPMVDRNYNIVLSAGVSYRF